MATAMYLIDVFALRAGGEKEMMKPTQLVVVP